MPSRSHAEEHLRVIRSLMERVTIYRAISAPSALLAGILAGLAGGFLAETPEGDAGFLIKWLVVFALATAGNLWFLRRDAARRGEVFASPGMRMALTAMLPPMLCGFVLSLLLPAGLIAIAWMLFYGLALLSTSHFAPRSLHWLGWSFVIAGLAASIYIYMRMGTAPSSPWGDWAMAVTFGGLHVIYAACAWPRREALPEPAAGT